MRDLRHYAQQTQVRLILGGLLILFVIGDGLIYIIYGRDPALFGLVCLAAGLMPVGLIILALTIIDWVVKKGNQE